jgi:subtilisin family serine protease
VSRLKLAAVAALTSLAALALPLTAASAQAPPPPTFELLSGKPPDNPTPASESPSGRIVVEFAARANLAPAAATPEWAARGASVAQTLQAQARSSQAQARALVDAHPGAHATAYWISNTLVVEGADDALRVQLGTVPGVTKVRPERRYELGPDINPKEALDLAAADPAWGVSKIGADKAWAQGAKGDGVVVATLDTGADYTHPALVNSYRGHRADGTFDHNYNWYDAGHVCPAAAPCDQHGHGTHTMGTIAGGDGPGPFTPDIGVAPGAKWMSAGCGIAFCDESELLAAGQFFVQPTDLSGANPDAAKRPDIVSNSWGGPGGDTSLQSMTRAWRAAGIIPVFSNGNSGPTCGTVGSPGDYADVFAVGATDSEDAIAYFSSRGPSSFGGGKPDVAAPGVDVYSAAPGGSYRLMSGTSMAAPHVAGELALLLSAAPALRGDFAGATGIVSRTAKDMVDTSCGGDADGDPNNVFGDGRIDADAAVSAAATGGTLSGVITDASSGKPISGARLRLEGGGRTYTAVTNAAGGYTVLVPAGTYTLTVELFGYETATQSGIVVTKGATTTVSLALKPAPKVTIKGRVTGAERGDKIAGARVAARGTTIPPTTTGPDGSYTLAVPTGTYTLEASLGGCTTVDTVDVVASRDVRADFVLSARTDSFGHGCAPTTMRWVDAQNETTLYGDGAYGRLRLPFAFPHYGKTYQAVYLTTDGYLTFDAPQYSTGYNSAIPNVSTPNNAIYPLWQDLAIDDDATVTYEAISGGPGGGRMVISYNNVTARSTGGRVSFQVHLFADGTIDILYDDTAAVNEGRTATIGLEDLRGADALQVGYREPNAPAHTAWRYTKVATAAVAGTVLDANDGTPVAGAVVTADPGGRSTTTGPDGRYKLALIPGPYHLTATAKGYESAGIDVEAEAGTTLEAPAIRLRAPVAGISPAALDLEAEAGKTTTASVTVSNTGGAPLTWEVRTAPAPKPRTGAPATPGAAKASAPPARWGDGVAPADAPATVTPQQAGTVPVVEDPVGDGGGPLDIVGIDAGADGEVATIDIRYAPGTPMSQIGGYLMLDTDQNPATGVSATSLYGKPTQDVGVEYYVSLFGSGSAGSALSVVRTSDYSTVGSVRARADGQTASLDLPLSLLGAGEEGDINLATVVGTTGPQEWAPDVGHGTVGAGAGLNWLTVAPEAGVAPAGGSSTVKVTAGAPDLVPGEYQAELRFRTSDPRRPAITVPVRLKVRVPAGYGELHGTVTDARGGTPVKGAKVTITAGGGTPFTRSVTTDAQGRYALYSPAGPARLTIAADHYVTSETSVDVVAGGDPVVDRSLRPVEPVAVVEGGPLSLTVPAGGTATGHVTVRNDGVSDLTVGVREREVRTAAAPGTTRVLSRGEPVTLAANGGDRTATPSSSEWRPSSAPDAEPKVLVYADDPEHPSPNTYVDQALKRLGIAYKAHYDGDFDGFSTDLTVGGWDAVIVADDNYVPPTALLTALQTYAANGGHLAVHSWQVSVTSSLPLWRTLGVDSSVDDSDPPDPVHWWDPGHPAVSVPEQVPEPTALSSGLLGTYGQHVGVVSGFEAVGGYTTTPTDREAALLVGNGGRTVFKGFLDSQNSADRDADGVKDGVELWADIIDGLSTGFATDVPWLSVKPAEATVAPGATVDLAVTVVAVTLSAGRHDAELVVSTNDPRARSVRVAVHVEVQGAPPVGPPSTSTTTTTTTTPPTSTTTTTTPPTTGPTTTVAPTTVTTMVPTTGVTTTRPAGGSGGQPVDR